MTDTSNSPRRESRTGWRLLTRWQLLIIVVLLLLFAGWRAGTFDRVLSNVGLQAHECARNGLGATFCGKELDEYRARINRVKREGEEGAARIKEEAASRQREYLATAKRQQEELAAREAQIQREGEEAQQRIQEGG